MVDQAVKNAVVCMDINANSMCDAGEPVSAKTGADGIYSLTYDATVVTAAQVAAASLIAPMVPGTVADATIDAANPSVPLTTRAYVLQQLPGKSGQINPLTTLVATGMKAGLAENTARTNASVQLAIAPAKIDNYQDDPATNPNALVDNARLMATVTNDALKNGVTLAVNALAAADAIALDLITLNYSDAANYYFRTSNNLAVAAGASNSDFNDLRRGLRLAHPWQPTRYTPPST